MQKPSALCYIKNDFVQAAWTCLHAKYSNNLFATCVL